MATKKPSTRKGRSAGKTTAATTVCLPVVGSECPALSDLGITKEVAVPLVEAMEMYLRARTLREQALERLYEVIGKVFSPLAALMKAHADIINETFGLHFKKSRNDLKSKLGQPPKPGEKPEKFGDARTKQLTSGPRESRDKKPLTQNLGDKMRAAGVVASEDESAATKH